MRLLAFEPHKALTVVVDRGVVPVTTVSINQCTYNATDAIPFSLPTADRRANEVRTFPTKMDIRRVMLGLPLLHERTGIGAHGVRIVLTRMGGVISHFIERTARVL